MLRITLRLIEKMNCNLNFVLEKRTSSNKESFHNNNFFVIAPQLPIKFMLLLALSALCERKI